MKGKTVGQTKMGLYKQTKRKQVKIGQVNKLNLNKVLKIMKEDAKKEMPDFSIYLCKKININVINLLPTYRQDNRKEDEGTNSRTNKEDLNKQTKRKQASKDW